MKVKKGKSKNYLTSIVPWELIECGGDNVSDIITFMKKKEAAFKKIYNVDKIIIVYDFYDNRYSLYSE